jgi:(p)ppGpp synthase/HD superfamily hydrolase
MLSLVDRAIGFATRAHKGQRRKTGNVPYIAHPFGVAMILQGMGCDETIVTAGLLHDTVEDTKVTLNEVRGIFGEDVARIVAAVTEPSKKNTDWESRKLHTIRILRTAPLPVKLVAAADKYHNLTHTQYNLEIAGPIVWKRFGRGREQQAWYYRSVAESITANVPDAGRYPIFDQLTKAVDEVFDGIPSKPPAKRRA